MSDPAFDAVGCHTTFGPEAYLHVAHTQNLLASHALLNCETRSNGKKRELAGVTELEDQVSDFRRCVPCCITQMCQRRPLGFWLNKCGPLGSEMSRTHGETTSSMLRHVVSLVFFMGPGDGPSMDRVYVKSTAKSTVRRYRHVVTPRVCLEQYAMKLHCGELHTASDKSDEQVLADQEELPECERGLFEVDAMDPDEVLPYTDEPFMEHVKAIATFDTVRAIPPDPTRRTVGKRGVNVQWQAGEHPTVS